MLKPNLQVEGWGDDDRGLAGCEYYFILSSFTIEIGLTGLICLMKGTCGPRRLAM